MNKYIVLASAVALWCVGCVVERVVYVKDSDSEAVSRVSCSCDARIVRVLGLSNDYFRDTDFFKSGKVTERSAEVELIEPFGPFNRAVCSLTTRTPNVVDVTTEDRSSSTNTLPRYFMETIALKRVFDNETTAEELEKEVEKLVAQLNDIFRCQLSSPIISPVVEADVKDVNQSGAQPLSPRRPLLGGLRRNYISAGTLPAMTVSIELKGQRIYVAAHEPVFCKRNGVIKLKSPAKLFMNIEMNQWVGNPSDDSDVEVKPIVLGGDNVKAFFGAFSTSEYGGFRSSSRSPAQYEYNLDTKRIMRNLDNVRRQGLDGGSTLRARRLQRQQVAAEEKAKADAAAAEKAAERAAMTEEERAQREAERAEQRRQLLAIQEELKRVRQAKVSTAKGACAVRCDTNKSTLGKGSVAEKLGECDFLLNKDFKKNAKFYLCLFSASWCPPCRREMPRIAKTYVETLKDDPDIELIHFSRDSDDDKAMDWAKKHDVKFPVVKPNGGNPLELHCNGIPHLFIVKADGTLLEEGHPMRIFNEEKFWEIKSGSVKSRTTNVNVKDGECTDQVDGYTWTYRVENGGAEIRSVSPKPTGDVSIPSMLGGMQVTKIGDEAFKNCDGLESVTIPNGVTSIGNSAFQYCRRLSSVTIPNSVKSIWRFAFFYCSGLTSVTIPASVTSIGSSAFNWCSGLTTIVVDVDNPRYKSIDNCLLSKNGTTLIRGSGSRCVEIPKGVTSIGENAFFGCSGLTSVTIPASVTSIEKSAFYSCHGLMSVSIPSSVTSIGEFAFGFCGGLTTIVVDVDNPRYKSIDNCLLSKDGVTLIRGPWSSCVVIPKGVTSIGGFAFSGCKGLTSVTIPSSVTSIGRDAFIGCSGLTEVIIPQSVTSIGGVAFSGCKGLTSVTIPSSVTSIGMRVFSDCKGLTSVTMCGERPDVENEAFARCDKLASIHVPANAKSWAGMKEWQGIPLVFDAESGK